MHFDHHTHYFCAKHDYKTWFYTVRPQCIAGKIEVDHTQDLSWADKSGRAPADHGASLQEGTARALGIRTLMTESEQTPHGLQDLGS